MNKFKIAIIWTTVLSPFLVLFTLILLAKTEFFGELPSFDQLENPKNNLATEKTISFSLISNTCFAYVS